MRAARSLWVGGLLLSCLFLSADRARGEGGETKKESRPVIDETQVYYGKAATCKAPAVVAAERVYREIPEYRKILDQKLTSGDAQYSLLMVNATRKFRAAVGAAAVDASCDLVGNLGSVTWDGHTVPDLTDATLKKLAEQAKTGN